MSEPLSQDKDLQAYFTDVEDLQDVFKTSLVAPELKKRLLVIHGVGGVGKSSLLRMFRLHSKKAGVPIGLASGDEAKSVVDVLARWAEDLQVDGIKLKEFSETYRQYRVIQAKVEEQVRKSGEMRGKAVDTVGKAASKAAVEAAASLIPVVGPIASVLGGIGAEALFDWLRGFLSKPEIDLYLDPTKRLTQDFLKEIDKAAVKQRLVLMLDTFEQMAVLDGWVRDLARVLQANVLLVIAGRGVPNWSRVWSEWMAYAIVRELTPMTDEVMRDLVRRYYAFIRGGEPDPKQVEAIIQFARGLPMVVNSAVRLWVEYGVEDFQAVKAEVVADLVDRLQEDVPERLYPILEAAATLRWFNKDLLRTVTASDVLDTSYDELRRFPFVRSCVQGSRVHDAIREIFNQYMRLHNPEQYYELHKRASEYFNTRMPNRTPEETEQSKLEYIYHCFCSDEPIGLRLFQEVAEEFTRYQLVTRLRALLNDVNSYPLERIDSCLWRDYYNARLAHLDTRWDEAEKSYQTIGEDERAEKKLRGYALCYWGGIRIETRYVRQPDGWQKLASIVEESNRFLPEKDPARGRNALNLAGACARLGKFDKALRHYQDAVAIYQESQDVYGVASVYREELQMFGLLGDWENMFAIRTRGLEYISQLKNVSRVYADILGSWSAAWVCAGRYKEAERNSREWLRAFKETGEDRTIGPYKDLGFSLGMQGRLEEAEQIFLEAIERESPIGEDPITYTLWSAVLIKHGRLDTAEKYLKSNLATLNTWLTDDWIPQNWYWLGELFELRHDLEQAEKCYRKCLEYQHIGRQYFNCGSLVGLTRVAYDTGNYSDTKTLLEEAEQLAHQYEYNDYLASLRMIQAQITWSGLISEWGLGFDVTLRYFQQALIYSLRYNRFVLDEVLWGGGICTLLQPIVPTCLGHGEEGRRMLMALRDWWQTGVNDVGVSRPDTISPIPEGTPLLEAERIARQREPGDGSPQMTVLERLEQALKQ